MRDYCAIVRDDPPLRVMGAALVREAPAVTALLAARAATAARAPQPDVALTPADAAG